MRPPRTWVRRSLRGSTSGGDGLLVRTRWWLMAALGAGRVVVAPVGGQDPVGVGLVEDHYVVA
ncbi:MAG: hypothetical protein JWR58_3676 [Pseudonocardia sp.]|nr:hypothetical protein [Pseudonocardia sp.]